MNDEAVVKAIVERAVAAERKACGQIAKAVHDSLTANLDWSKGARWAADEIGRKIRARGKETK